MKSRAEMGQPIVCPYCGQKGTVIRVLDDGHVDVAHQTEKRHFTGKATGKPVEYEAFLDGCSKDGKIGSLHHVGAVVEEDF